MLLKIYNNITTKNMLQSVTTRYTARGFLQQEEREGPEDTSNREELTVEVTIEGTVASESQQVVPGGDTSVEHIKGYHKEHFSNFILLSLCFLEHRICRKHDGSTGTDVYC